VIRLTACFCLIFLLLNVGQKNVLVRGLLCSPGTVVNQVDFITGLEQVFGCVEEAVKDPDDSPVGLVRPGITVEVPECMTEAVKAVMLKQEKHMPGFFHHQMQQFGCENDLQVVLMGQTGGPQFDQQFSSFIRGAFAAQQLTQNDFSNCGINIVCDNRAGFLQFRGQKAAILPIVSEQDNKKPWCIIEGCVPVHIGFPKKFAVVVDTSPSKKNERVLVCTVEALTP